MTPKMIDSNETLAILKMKNPSVLKRLVEQQLLENHAPPKKHMRFRLSQVRELTRFYKPKGKDWKKSYLAWKADASTPVPVRRDIHLPPVRREQAPIVQQETPASRLERIEAKLDVLTLIIVRLEGMWS